jgi:hypothetical protein
VARGIPYAALRRQTPLPRIVSQPGKKNGLYWPAASEEDESPLGVLAASAAAEGYRAGQQRMPYHGYYYRREDVCGSRATPLAIPSSAVCLRIDDFATSDQMGAREKSRPV